MKKLQVISPDRISALPEPIIHRILSLLPTKSIKLATSLSKTWYDFCSSFPCLDFEDYYVDGMFVRYHYDIEFFNDEDFFNPKLIPLGERYVKYVGETLCRFHERNPRILIQRIRIPITLINPRFVSLLGYWIQLVLEHGVEKIDLRTRGYCYNLPTPVFTSNSIRVLKLRGCSLLESFGHVDISVCTSKLRKLVINGVYIDELALEYVISICPLMEKLEIKDAMGLTNLRISRLPKLKSLVVHRFHIDDLKMVEVDAPMLHCLKLLNGCKIGILECPRLAELSLSNVKVKNFQLEEILSRLPLLSCLWLTNLCLVTKFKISNDSLKKLAIINCTSLVELEVNASNLLLFEFVSDSVPLMSSMHTIMGQSYITLNIGQEPSLVDNFVVNFRNFVSRLERINDLRIYIQMYARFILDERKERVAQPVANIEELKILVEIFRKKSAHFIFNGMLWSCHPRILTIMHLGHFEKADVVRFLRDIMVDVDSCCSWLPYLEEIKFVGDNGNEIRLPVDGSVHPIALESCSWCEVKFVFKW